MNAWSLIFTDRRLLFSAFVCFVSMGGFFAWAWLAPLAEGVTAFGTVAVQNDRKIVQHLEGGIIDQIHVKEGDTVSAGQPLVILTDIAASAGREQVTQDLVNSLAAIDRLTALLANAETVTFSPEIEHIELDQHAVLDIKARQTDLFAQQKRSLDADIRVLRSRADGLLERARNQQAQIDGQERAVEIIKSDLDRKRKLLEENLIAGDSVLEIERDLSFAENELFGLVADQEQSFIDAREVENQISQIKAQFDEDAAQELLEARAAAGEATERLRAAQDVVNRTTLHAPIAGEILNLKYSTLGGVVQPGEAIAEIVPQDTQLVAVLEIPPIERDRVYEGLIVRLRLSGYDSWRSSGLEGQIMDVTPDLKWSANGDHAYYEARVLLDADALGQEGMIASPGMPVEAFVSSGQTRALLDYLIEPIEATLRRGLKE